MYFKIKGQILEYNFTASYESCSHRIVEYKGPWLLSTILHSPGFISKYCSLQLVIAKQYLTTVRLAAKIVHKGGSSSH